MKKNESKKSGIVKTYHGFDVFHYLDDTWKIWCGKKRFRTFEEAVRHMDREYYWHGK